MRTKKMEDATQPLVSIIVPVYNVEPYLERCLRSVTGQTYANLQVILVDDGSTDLSGDICDRWEREDDRIEVIHGVNTGLATARNTGMERAEGDYLTFVDSDDYIEPRMVEVMLEASRERKVKVCCCGFIKEEPDGASLCGVPPEKLSYSGHGEMLSFMKDVLGPLPEKTDRGFAGMYACGVLYEASLFEDQTHRFPNVSMSEDLYFNLALYKRIDRVYIVPQCLYHYCVNETSLMQKYQEGRFERCKEIWRYLGHELQDEISECSDMQSHIDRNYMDYLIGCMKVEIRFWRQKKNRRCCLEEIRGIAKDEITQLVLGRYPVMRMALKQKLLFWAIKHRWVHMIYGLFCLRYKL